MFEGCICVRLNAQRNHSGEMLMVNVRINTEQSLQYRLGHGHEVIPKRYTCKKITFFIIQRHQSLIQLQTDAYLFCWEIVIHHPTGPEPKLIKNQCTLELNI